MGSKNTLLYVGMLALIVVVSCLSSYAFYQFQFGSSTVGRETLFQVAAFNTFSSGAYDGIMPYNELVTHGDFGIGTFDRLDGEMVALDGAFYQVPYNGMPRRVDPGNKAPYATITYFEADQTVSIGGPMTYSELKAYIDGLLTDVDAIYAIKIRGTYDYVLTRSVPMQTAPYPPISEVVKNQSVFTMNGSSGTAVGFWFPGSMEGVDYAGYHLHFITDRRDAGGHLLDCIAGNVTIEIDQTKEYTLVLP